MPHATPLQIAEKAKAAIACAPPIWKTCDTLSMCAVPKTSSTALGQHAQMLGTPATCAGTTVMMSVEGSG